MNFPFCQLTDQQLAVIMLDLMEQPKPRGEEVER